MSAVWNLARSQTSTFPSLQNHIDVDVAIIGGGATGLATASILCEGGERVAVIEAREVGSGSSGTSTGNLYATVSQGLSGIRKKWGQDTVNRVVEMRRRALDDIERNVERFAIDCQFERRSLHFCIQDEADRYGALLEDEYRTSAAAGLPAETLERPADLGFAARRVLRIAEQAQYNPRQYCDGLARAVMERDGSIYENSPVASVDPGEGRVTTVGGQVINAGHIVFATHTPKGINMLQAEMEAYREHGIAAPLKNGGQNLPPGIFWMLDKSVSLRTYHYQGQAYCVVIGSKHLTGHGEQGQAYYEQLADYARSQCNISAVSHRWSAQQYRSADLLPYIGRSGHDYVYVATGYGADGLVWSEVAAKIISHQILGRKDWDGDLVNPRRFTPGKSARVWLEAGTNVAKHLSTDRFSVEKQGDLHKIPGGEGRVLKVNGEIHAAYRSPDGELKLLSPVCPHMKCLVHWNSADQSWDCPCHGSRFTIDGEVIEGPAYLPLEKRSPPP